MTAQRQNEGQVEAKGLFRVSSRGELDEQVCFSLSINTHASHIQS